MMTQRKPRGVAPSMAPRTNPLRPSRRTGKSTDTTSVSAPPVRFSSLTAVAERQAVRDGHVRELVVGDVDAARCQCSGEGRSGRARLARNLPVTVGAERL